MKGFPAELIYVLVFIGIFLLQYLMKRRGSRAPAEPAPDASVPSTIYETREDLVTLGPPTRQWPLLPESDEPTSRTENSASGRVRPRGRFALRTLMGTQRDVQNAVVVAVILGPPRAFDP